MSGTVLLILAAICGICGVAVLRLAWAQRRRSLALNTAGWALVALSLLAGAAAAGAWGVSVATLWIMGAAFALLAWAAWRSPPARTAASNRRAGMLPEQGQPSRVAGRALTFVLVGILSPLPAVGMAVAMAALGEALGWSRANGLALAFFTAPLSWMVLTYLLLMQTARRGQWKVLALACLPAVPALAAGVLA